MTTLRDQILKQILRDGLERGHRDVFTTERAIRRQVNATFENIMSRQTLCNAAPRPAASASRVKNHVDVVTEATRLLDLRKAVDEAEALSNLQLEGRNETVMDYLALGMANKHFKEVIEKNFSEAFWAYGPFGAEKRTKENQEICVRKILLEVQKLILDEILNQPDAFETPRVKAWVRAHKHILLDPTHPDYRKILAESREYLNSKESKDNHRHTAWRNFDPGAPLDSIWAPLFLPPQAGDERNRPYSSGGTETNLAGQRNDCRLRLAYYYLVAIDDHESKKKVERINNLIDELYECRRAHNITISAKKKLDDDPSCYPGTIRRLAQMGKDHSVAVLPNDPMTLLPEIFKEYVNEVLQTSFRHCKTYKEKVELFKALRDFENFDATSKIARNITSYSRELLDIRQRFLKALGDNQFLFNSIINVTLRGQRCPFELNPLNIYHTSKLDLLRFNIWSFAFDGITKHFWQSLTPSECTTYRTETSEQPPAGITIAEVINDDPFADEICKRECDEAKKEAEESGVPLLLRTLPGILEQIREGFRIKKIAWTIFLKEGLEKKKALEVANQLGDTLCNAKEYGEIKQKSEEVFSTMPSSFVDNTKRPELIKRLLEVLGVQQSAPVVPLTPVVPSVSVPAVRPVIHVPVSVVVSTEELKAREIKAKKESGELPRIGFVSKLSKCRLDLWVGRVAPYSEIDLPRAPLIHPLCPTGLDRTKMRLESGMPNILVTARIPDTSFRSFPKWVSDICGAQGVHATKLKAFLVIQNMPWRDEALTFNPQTWLHGDAPACGPYQRRTPVVMGVTDVHRMLLPEDVVPADNLEIRGENGQTLRYFNNKQLAGIENFNESHFLYSICINSATHEAALTYHWMLNDADFKKIKSMVDIRCRSHNERNPVTLEIILRELYVLIGDVSFSLSETAQKKGKEELENLLTHNRGVLGVSAKFAAEEGAHNYRLCNMPSHIVAAVEQLDGTRYQAPLLTPMYSQYAGNAATAGAAAATVAGGFAIATPMPASTASGSGNDWDELMGGFDPGPGSVGAANARP